MSLFLLRFPDLLLIAMGFAIGFWFAIGYLLSRQAVPVRIAVTVHPA